MKRKIIAVISGAVILIIATGSIYGNPESGHKEGEQVMSISTKCIIEKCGRVNKWSLDRVLKAVRIQMGMEEKTT